MTDAAADAVCGCAGFITTFWWRTNCLPDSFISKQDRALEAYSNSTPVTFLHNRRVFRGEKNKSVRAKSSRRRTMDLKNFSQRGFFEGKWKSLCDHSTCEKIQPSLKNDCFCITCHINHDADVDILSQNGFRYDCLRRGLQNGLNISSSDQKAPSGAGCPVEKQFFLLQKVLRETSLPATVDRRDDPIFPTGDEITIVYFAELEESLAAFFEGR